MSFSGRSPASPIAGLEQGRSAFNRGEYFLAHELWEEVWRGLPGGSMPGAAGGQGGAEQANSSKAVVHGLIQIAAGCHHLSNHRTAPAIRLLEKGLAKIAAAAAADSAVMSPSPGLLDANHVRAFVGSVTTMVAALSGAPLEALPDPRSLKL